MPAREAATVPATVDVRLRRMPHPYRAMLAICSDLDETPNAATYAEIMRFLNTTEPTVMGTGLGLEVGNTIYFDMPDDQFAYRNTDDAGRAMVRDLIRSGHIDCLHSYGDYATSRRQCGRAIEELMLHGLRMEGWVDHAVAPSNFGPDIMRGYGDVRGSNVYHADLTCDLGVRYVWRGRVTSVIGQDVPRRLGGIWDGSSPLASAQTVVKEAIKGATARLGSTRYAMHAPNRLYRAAHLRDGRAVWEFLRFDPFAGGVGRAATADGLPRVMTERMLRTFVEREGAGILYTHLGRTKCPSRPFNDHTCAALRHLADLASVKEILVTTTTRLLRYMVARDHLDWSVATLGGRTVITIGELVDPVRGTRVPTADDLMGLSFDVLGSTDVQIRSATAGMPRVTIDKSADGCCVSIPWSRLEFPDIDATLRLDGREEMCT